ncbi:MAG: ferrous iron transport protein B [Desulfurococcaceae archaeon TW002]
MALRKFGEKICDYVVAVVGQPSVGKSTFFTQVTGELVRVANWPGTTVEQKVGIVSFKDKVLCLVDLPGIYGLSPTSLEEKITKNFLISSDWDVILVLADALIPERSIYLPIQVSEMTSKLVVALTKWDSTHKVGLHVDVKKLSSRLGFPVIPISSITGEGIREVLSTLVDVAEGRIKSNPLKIDYGLLDSYLNELIGLIDDGYIGRLPRRWVALRLLEGDQDIIDLVRSSPDIIEKTEKLREEFRKATERTPEEIAILKKYEYATQVVRETVVRMRVRPHITAIIDKIYLNPLLGPLASIITIFALFAIAFTLNTGFPFTFILRHLGFEVAADALETHSLSGLLESFFAFVGDVLRTGLADLNEELVSLVVDGILGGLGTVLSFLPLIFLVSASFSVLEDSGLGPRMVASLHNFFRFFGLSGRALYPLVIALGCNVPAVYQSRISIDEAERREIIVSASFIICQARLIVLLYFTKSLFLGNAFIQASVITLLYILSIILYLLTAKLVRILSSVRESPELIMELPMIHRPSLKVVWWGSWINTRHFLYKAGIIIFALSVLSWVLLSYGPTGYVDSPEASYGAILGSYLGRVLEVLYNIRSENSWMIGYALIYGFIAKEGLIASVSQLTGLAEEEALRSLGLNVAQGVSLLIFVMFYIPCMATVATIYQESKSLRFTLYVTMYLIIVALIISLVAYWILLIA